MNGKRFTSLLAVRNHLQGVISFTKLHRELPAHPNDGSRPSLKSRDGSLDRFFEKKKYDGGGKASFARFEHPGRRSIHLFHDIFFSNSLHFMV